MNNRVFVDASGTSERSQIIDALTALPEVPADKVTIAQGRVFVLNKLAALVCEYPDIAGTLDNLDAQGVQELVVDAWVTPAEAVEHWSVWPYPYICERVDDHGNDDDAITRPYVIHHVAFNADLPGVYATLDERNHALGELLLGRVLPGEGTTTFRGQPMTPRDDLDTENLPPCPDLEAPTEIDNAGVTLDAFRYLEGVAFIPGFAPVDHALFDEVQTLEASNAEHTCTARIHARQRAAELWQLSAHLHIDELNEPGTMLAEQNMADVRRLRDLYPELTKLNAATLYNYFDTFQRECRFQPDWLACRDDAFLFFLLGHCAGVSKVPRETEEAGEVAGHAVLMGYDTARAYALTRDWQGYHQALRALAFRVATAVLYVREATR